MHPSPHGVQHPAAIIWPNAVEHGVELCPAVQSPVQLLKRPLSCEELWRQDEDHDARCAAFCLHDAVCIIPQKQLFIIQEAPDSGIPQGLVEPGHDPMLLCAGMADEHLAGPVAGALLSGLVRPGKFSGLVRPGKSWWLACKQATTCSINLTSIAKLLFG